jgi:hypothetical protein
MGQTLAQCHSSECDVCGYGDPNVANDCPPDSFANGLVPYQLDLGLAKMKFDKVEFTDRPDGQINLSEFLIRGVTMAGTFFADIGDKQGSCTCRVPSFCGSRFDQKSTTGSIGKWGIRIVLNLETSPASSLKVVVHDIHIFRCPVALNRIIPEDRLETALRTNLTEHISSKIEELKHTCRIQSLVIDEDSSYAAPPKPYDQ